MTGYVNVALTKKPIFQRAEGPYPESYVKKYFFKFSHYLLDLMIEIFESCPLSGTYQ